MRNRPRLFHYEGRGLRRGYGQGANTPSRGMTSREIRERIADAGETMQRVAARAGVTMRRVSDVIAGREHDLSVARAIAQCIGCRPADIFPRWAR